MLKTVLSYFKPLTREQLELRRLQTTQEARLQLEARSNANASVAAEVIDLVGVIDDDDVGDAVPVAFEQIIEVCYSWYKKHSDLSDEGINSNMLSERGPTE